jgi:hypothetical protein
MDKMWQVCHLNSTWHGRHWPTNLSFPTCIVPHSSKTKLNISFIKSDLKIKATKIFVFAVTDIYFQVMDNGQSDDDFVPSRPMTSLIHLRPLGCGIPIIVLPTPVPNHQRLCHRSTPTVCISEYRITPSSEYFFPTMHWHTLLRLSCFLLLFSI